LSFSLFLRLKEKIVLFCSLINKTKGLLGIVKVIDCLPDDRWVVGCFVLKKVRYQFQVVVITEKKLRRNTIIKVVLSIAKFQMVSLC
jgi:hypothetical protein